MELKDILPLIGVAAGWFLKEFSDGFKQRGEQRARVGKALTRLFQLHDEVRRLKMHQAFIKDRPGSWAEYEGFRVRAARRYLDQRGGVQETVQEAVDLVSSRWPFDAVDLGSVKVLLTWYYKMELSALASDPEKYVNALSSLEVGLDLADQLLRRLVLKLARLHSPITWIRVRLIWRRHQSPLAQKNREFGEQQLTELYGESETKAEPPST
jgi:hypothetical protein